MHSDHYGQRGRVVRALLCCLNEKEECDILQLRAKTDAFARDFGFLSQDEKEIDGGWPTDLNAL